MLLDHNSLDTMNASNQLRYIVFPIPICLGCPAFSFIAYNMRPPEIMIYILFAGFFFWNEKEKNNNEWMTRLGTGCSVITLLLQSNQEFKLIHHPSSKFFIIFAQPLLLFYSFFLRVFTASFWYNKVTFIFLHFLLKAQTFNN